MSYNKVTKDIFLFWIKDYFYSISSFIIPLFVGFILLFANKNCFLSAASSLFTILSIFVLCISGFCLPIFIFKIKNNSVLQQKYANYLNSWKLTYFIAIYAFVYTVVIATIGFLIWLILFSILATSNYYTNYLNLDSNNLFKLWINNISFINWVEILFYLGYQTILAISIAFLLNALIKNKKILFIVIVLIFSYNFLFIGILSYDWMLTDKFNKNLFIGFSYLAIYSFCSINGWISTMGLGSFDFVQNVSLLSICSNTNISLNYIFVLMNFTIPFIVISICISFSSIFFRWFNTNNEQLEVIDKNSLSLIKSKNFIINMLWILFSIVFVIIGISCTIAANISFKHIVDNTNKIVNNPKYISGVLFLILGIINLSLSSGYLIKNIYVHIQNKLNIHLNQIYND